MNMNLILKKWKKKIVNISNTFDNLDEDIIELFSISKKVDDNNTNQSAPDKRAELNKKLLNLENEIQKLSDELSNLNETLMNINANISNDNKIIEKEKK